MHVMSRLLIQIVTEMILIFHMKPNIKAVEAKPLPFSLSFNPKRNHLFVLLSSVIGFINIENTIPRISTINKYDHYSHELA